MVPPANVERLEFGARTREGVIQSGGECGRDEWRMGEKEREG